MLPKSKLSEGKTIVLLLLGVGVLLLGGVYLAISKNKNIEQNSALSISPTRNEISWATFNDPKLQLALNYPTTYFFEDVTKSSSRLKPSLAVNFAPKDENLRETESVFLTVYPKGTFKDSAAWVDKYTSEDNKPQIGTPSAKYFNVSNIATSSLGTTYIQFFPDTSQKLETTVIAGEKYIILMSHTQGYANSIYQKMFDSLTY